MPELGVGELLFWLMSVAVLVVIGGLIVALGLRIAGSSGADPRRILRERLARGEITQAEFEDANRILGR
jgi:uncharacterized membrane protein